MPINSNTCECPIIRCQPMNSKQPMKTNYFKTAGLLAGLLCFGAGLASAGTVTNADTSANLNAGASWVGGTPPGAADEAVWNSTVQANTTKSLGANLTWGGIQILNPAGLITINADGNALTNGSLGIDLSAAMTGLTLGNPIVLSTNQTWSVTNGQTLTAAGAVSGASRLVLNNGGNNLGTIIMSVANTYSGGTVINSGFAQPNTATSFGTGAVTNNGGTLELSSFPNSGIMVNAFNVTGTSFIDMANKGSSFVLDGAWSGNGTILVTNDTSSGSTLTFGGASGGNMASFTGSVVVVTNSSGTASAGAIRFNNGGSDVNTGNSAMSVNLGTNSTVVLENRDAGTTSIGELTGGAGTTVTGQTSGNGTEIWSIGGKNTSATFGGAFVNKGSAALTALSKVGTGTFTLTGTNTFTGAVTISAGVLQVGDGGTDGVLGGGAVANNASLVFDRSDTNLIDIANNITGSGTVIFQAGGTNFYTGTNTSSGTTIISSGDLILGPSGLMSCPISVSSAGTFDVSQNPAFVLNQTLSGSGSVTGLVTAAGGSINPGGTAAAGTLTFDSGLTESGNINNQIELSSPSGTNDLIYVIGNLTLTGTNNITLSHFGGGTIPSGTYPLFAYTGTLSGGIGNFLVTAIGVNGILTNLTSLTPPELAVIISPTARGATNLVWKGDGAANNWDLTSSNWLGGPTSFSFQTGDSVVFNDAGAANPNVNVALLVLPAAVVVSNSVAYTLAGAGGIGGATGLVKTNSGLLTIATTNTYTGSTIIGKGVLETLNLGISGSGSSIGAASSDPSNLVVYASILRYSGPNTTTDRGVTLNSLLSTLDVTNSASTLAENGLVTGPGTLNKAGAGTLTLETPNTYAGGTVISNGVLALGSNGANNNGTGGGGLGSTNNSVTFYGGTLQLFGYTGSTANNFNTLYNPLVVPAGQSGTLQLFPRGPINTGASSGINSGLSGAGTLNLVVNYVRDALSGNWSAFTGLINVTSKNAAGDEMRINNNFGYASATIYLNGTLNLDSTLTAGATINIGFLGRHQHGDHWTG